MALALEETSAPTERASGTYLWVYLIAAVLSGFGLAGKASLVGASHLKGLVVAAAIIGACFTPVLLWRLALRLRRVVGPLVLFGVLLAALIGFPRVEALHAQGRGTDQPDCVIVAGTELAHGQWPYQRKELWSHNSMSCGAGWVALQVPALVAAGYAASLIVIWSAAIGALVRILGWDRTSAAVSLMGLSPGLWLAACNGTDFLPFGLCIAVLCLAEGLPKRCAWIYSLLAGLVVQFRIPTIALPGLLSRDRNFAARVGSAILAVLTQLGFLVWNAKGFLTDGPFSVVGKVSHAFSFSSGSPETILVAIGSLTLVCIAAFVVGRRSGGPGLTLGYLFLIFFVPAIFGLAQAAFKAHSLDRWEGGMWLVACIPLAAVQSVIGQARLPNPI